MLGLLAAAAYYLGPAVVFKLYVVPYFLGVMYLASVTYLQHHGPATSEDRLPWYRDEVMGLP